MVIYKIRNQTNSTKIDKNFDMITKPANRRIQIEKDTNLKKIKKTTTKNNKSIQSTRRTCISISNAHSHSYRIYSTMIIFTLVLSVCVQMAHTRSTNPIKSFPVASSVQAASSIQRLSSATPNAKELSTQILAMRQKFSIETNSIPRYMSDASNNSGEHLHGRSLKRVFLSVRNITCNDGSQAGFYLRKNPNSKKWIVFLEGGWHCYDIRTCKARWLRLRHLMTSAQWPEYRDVGGILSPLPEENPYWHNANHVLVPYCSSDSWSGTRAEAESKDSWRFMGAVILRQVIADLIPLGLERANGAELLLVGSSAGGLGVMLNLDRITHFLQHERNILVTVRGVSDSGWFLDREPYTPSAVASSDAVRQGWKLWQGLLPEECTKQHEKEPWRCYFGYRLYPTLQSPLFVFQWLFDEAQMRADNVGAPVTPQQWNYIHEMGGALRSSLDNVTAVFAPSCIGHAVLSKRDWVNIKIDDISLPAALRCWEHSTRQRRKRHNKLKRATEATLLAAGKSRNRNGHKKKQHKQREHIKENSIGNENNNNSSNNRLDKQGKRNHVRLSKEEREERKRQRIEKQQRRRENRNQRKKLTTENSAPNDSGNDTASTHTENVTSVHEKKQKHRFNNNNNNKHSSNNHNNNDSNSNTNDSDSFHKNTHKSHNNPKRRRRKQHQRQQHQKKQHQREQHKKNDEESQSNEKIYEQSLQREKLINTVESRNHENNNNNAKNRRRNRVPRVPEKCALRLLERCSWPQCNHSCPTLTNPLTGEEMRFLELLTSFGLDIEAVAAALGVDMHTLSNMDRTELVNLLTQQVS